MPNEKKYYYLLILLFFSILFADEFVIKSFVRLENDLSARRYEKKDINNDACALIKVKTDIREHIQFDSNLGIPHVPILYQKGEYWVYVSPGERTLKLMADGFLPYTATLTGAGVIESLYTYELEVSSKELNIKTVPVTILSKPEDAEKWVDGQLLGTGKTFTLKIGEHNLLVKKEEYKNYQSLINVTSDNVFFNNINLEKIEIVPVQISTKPEGATVFINNAERGKTELPLWLFPGKYSIKLNMGGYLNISDSILVVEGQTNDFSYNLQKNAGYVIFDVTPGDSYLMLNGKRYSPGRIELIPGDYQVTISREGYINYEDIIDVELGKTVEYSYGLIENIGTLVLGITPSDAVLNINNNIYSPGTIDLTPGTYRIAVSKDGYISQESNIELKLGETLARSFELIQNIGTLVLDVFPSQANILINNISYDKKTIDLVPGSYKILLELEGWHSYEEIVTLKLGETLYKSYALRQKTGSLQFEILPFSTKIQMFDNTGKLYKTWEGMHYEKNIPASNYKLICKHEGYKTEERRITINDNENYILSINMIKDTINSSSSHGIEEILINGGNYIVNGNTVKIDDYYISIYEMTQDIFIDIMHNNPSFFIGENRPVERVSLLEVVEFCNSLSEHRGLDKVYIINGDSGNERNIIADYSKNGYRLPTVLEWEYAAKSGGRDDRPWSGTNKKEMLEYYARFYFNSHNMTHPVGSRKPNDLGIFDMSGNVSEMCCDSLSVPFDIFNIKTSIIVKNMGGNWSSTANQCLSDYALDSYLIFKNNKTGFRITRNK
ncbi:PEGA domain-containing protein [bacterium]|nr:PEGA domain-containing protein [bacterium]